MFLKVNNICKNLLKYTMHMEPFLSHITQKARRNIPKLGTPEPAGRFEL